jgi:hypothetical protein
MSGLIITVGICAIIFIIGLVIQSKSTYASEGESLGVIGVIMSTIGGVVAGACLLASLLNTPFLETITYEPNTITKTKDGHTVISYMDTASIMQTIISDKAPIYLTDNANIVVKKIIRKNHWNARMGWDISITIRDKSTEDK